jgi:hypothetical protein
LTKEKSRADAISPKEMREWYFAIQWNDKNELWLVGWSPEKEVAEKRTLRTPRY